MELIRKIVFAKNATILAKHVAVLVQIIASHVYNLFINYIEFTNYKLYFLIFLIFIFIFRI